GRGLVEQQSHGLRLLGLGDQHGVAAQHHRLVLQLVAVDPGEDAGQARVGHAVGDAVQQLSGGDARARSPKRELQKRRPPAARRSFPQRCPALCGASPELLCRGVQKRWAERERVLINAVKQAKVRLNRLTNRLQSLDQLELIGGIIIASCHLAACPGTAGNRGGRAP
uniref:Uncharacterized protein n=1 Tax=Anas zonorhyncha TaxID=75864 RepID=A0A8B9U2C0_9AVES